VEAPDFAQLDEYKYENDRHRVIVALLIADFFLFLMKHLKNNHILQFIYVSQLVVDANGVLVLLKFLNQDFAKLVDFAEVKSDALFDFSLGCGAYPMERVMDHAINSLLKLMYKTCRNQAQRIKDYLVQYKAALIMKRIITKFEKASDDDVPGSCSQLVRNNAAKIIKIQIRYMNRTWRKNNMKIVSLVYQYVKIRGLDDWLAVENAIDEEQLYLTQDEIRHLNSDFNYKHYIQYYEKLDEIIAEKEAGKSAEGELSLTQRKPRLNERQMQ
jgi:hypothetical protein